MQDVIKAFQKRFAEIQGDAVIGYEETKGGVYGFINGKRVTTKVPFAILGHDKAIELATRSAQYIHDRNPQFFKTSRFLLGM